MKKSTLAISGIVILGTLGVGSDVEAQNCTRLAETTARALANQYCEIVKDADADRLVIEPHSGGPGSGERAIEILVPECTRTHSLICKDRMATLVGEDEYCKRLYDEGFNFQFKDDFTGEVRASNSRTLYGTLQRAGCRLH